MVPALPAMSYLSLGWPLLAMERGALRRKLASELLGLLVVLAPIALVVDVMARMPPPTTMQAPADASLSLMGGASGETTGGSADGGPAASSGEATGGTATGAVASDGAAVADGAVVPEAAAVADGAATGGVAARDAAGARWPDAVPEEALAALEASAGTDGISRALGWLLALLVVVLVRGLLDADALGSLRDRLTGEQRGARRRIRRAWGAHVAVGLLLVGLTASATMFVAPVTLRILSGAERLDGGARLIVLVPVVIAAGSVALARLAALITNAWSVW